MAKSKFGKLVVGAAIVGAAYAAYKNKDKIMNKLMDKFPKDDEDTDDFFDFEDSDTVQEFDTTGDGNIDIVAVDTSGDGRADKIFEDTTGDGKADTAFVDTTGDGIVDTVIDLTNE